MGGIDIGDLIAKEEVVISMTHLGYIKRMALTEYKSQNRGGVGVTAHKTKEEDFVDQIFTTNTHDDLLFFTTKGKVYTIKAYEVPEAQRTAKGRAVVNLIQVDADEKVSAVVQRKEGAEGYLVMATKNGLVKRTALSEFDSIRKSGKIAISLTKDDELIGAALTNGEQDILVAASNGKCIRFPETDVRMTGRESQGVKSIDLIGDAKVIDMTIVRAGTQVITITENGYGKRSRIEDYKQQNRGGLGVKAAELNDKTGKLVALKQTDADKDVMMIADNGVIIRTPVDDISVFARVSQGVKIMKLKESNKVVSVAVVDKEEESQDDSEEVIVEDNPEA